uniref:Uncharacterized protein n=1 Tax=Oryza glumipatula TaxID=40148 RepID=A0A0D9ZS96_9ORYZ
MVVVPLGPATRTHSASGKRKPIAATPAADPHLDHVDQPRRADANQCHCMIKSCSCSGRQGKGHQEGEETEDAPSTDQQLFSEAIAVDPQFVIVPLRGDAMLLAHCILSSQAQKLSSAIPSRIKDAYMHAR